MKTKQDLKRLLEPDNCDFIAGQMEFFRNPPSLDPPPRVFTCLLRGRKNGTTFSHDLVKIHIHKTKRLRVYSHTSSSALLSLGTTLL